MYILSNNNPRNVPFLKENMGLDGTVKQAFYSCEYGTIKPEEKFFRILLEQTSVDTSETIFIDDRRENLDVAQSLGMHTILFSSNIQLEKDLRKLASF